PRHVRATLDRLAGRLQALDHDIHDAFRRLEAESGRAVAPAAPSGSRRRGGEPGVAADGAKGPGIAAGVPTAPVTAVPGALGAAFNLLGLLRTDYAITGTAVSATPSELTTLVAAHLAEQEVAGGPAKVLVEADAFATMRSSPSTDS